MAAAPTSGFGIKCEINHKYLFFIFMFWCYNEFAKWSINNVLKAKKGDIMKFWKGCGKWGAFKADASLVEQYTGAHLTREQFASYSKNYTLRKIIGSDSEIRNKYYGFGITMQMSRVDIVNDILDHLARAGIVFNLEQGSGNEPVFKTLESGARICLAQDNWPRIPEPYRESRRLIEAVQKIRQERNLPFRCVVL